MRIYAVPQKIHPKKESNKELIKESRSAKNGMTSAMIKATTQVTARMPAQAAHPMTVWLVICRLFWKIRKKTNLAETEAYSTPKKTRVGIMKENETFL